MHKDDMHIYDFKQEVCRQWMPNAQHHLRRITATCRFCFMSTCVSVSSKVVFQLVCFNSEPENFLTALPLTRESCLFQLSCLADAFIASF